MEWLIVGLLVIAGFANPIAWVGAVLFAVVNLVTGAGEKKARRMSRSGRDGSGLMVGMGLFALAAFIGIMLLMRTGM